MAYTIYRKNHFKDEITLHDGDKVMTLQVDIHIDQIMRDYVKVVELIDRVRAGQEKGAGDKTELLADAIRDYLVLLFGADQTERLLAFYEDSPAELLSDLLPYITDKLNPQIAAVQRRMAKSYRK